MNVLWIKNWRTLLHRRRADSACALTRWQHFSAWNYIIAAIQNEWRHIKNLSWSIDAYLLGQPAKFHPDPIWNDAALGFFEKVAPTTTTTTTSWAAIWDQFLIQTKNDVSYRVLQHVRVQQLHISNNQHVFSVKSIHDYDDDDDDITHCGRKHGPNSQTMS